LIRAGQLGRTLREGFLPVVAAHMTRYRRPLRRFAPFQVHTQIVFWDEKDAFVEQTLECAGQTMARSVSRYRFPGGKRTKSPVEMMRMLWNVESPPAPEWIAPWREIEGLVAPHEAKAA
jgi:acyl-CoA thioesterase FadM